MTQVSEVKARVTITAYIPLQEYVWLQEECERTKNNRSRLIVDLIREAREAQEAAACSSS